MDRWSPDEGLLTASEVARMLHISRSQVYILMDRGDLPGLRIGAARRFRRQDLRRYLSRQPDRIRRSAPFGPPTIQGPHDGG
jgi:excisionase family DNA binding protein